MALIAIAAYGFLLVGAYVLVRGIELAIAWHRYARRVRDARGRNEAAWRRASR